MLRVLRTDLFRLFRSKCFYAYPVFLCITLILSLVFSVHESHTEETSNDTRTEVTEDADDGEFGIEIKVGIDDAGRNDDEKIMTIGWKDLLEAMYDGMAIMFTTIVLIIFSTSETKRGFIKNAAGCVKDRAHMVLSKMIIGAVINVIYVIEYAVIAAISISLSAVISGRSLQWEGLPQGKAMENVGFYILCFCVNIAFITMILLIHEVFRSRSIGVVLAFILTSGLIEQMIHGCVYLIRQFFGILEDFNIGKYLLQENINEGFGKAAYFPENVGIMCLIYIFGCTILAVWVSRKKDIR